MPGVSDYKISNWAHGYISMAVPHSLVVKAKFDWTGTNHMSHFKIEQWADFSRGLDSAIDRSAMESHLLTGCPRCSRLVKMFGSVAAVARTEAAYEPPAGAVRLATAIYQIRKPERLLARLVFDTFRQPLPAGVRTQDRQTRHALYEAGGYSVDLRLDHQRPADMASIIGQLADRDHPGVGADDVRVELKTREQILASANCNRFGEFQLHYRPAPALRLDVILGASGKRLELPLSGLTDPPAARKPRGKKARPAG
jgi:hypothetical protein